MPHRIGNALRPALPQTRPSLDPALSQTEPDTAMATPRPAPDRCRIVLVLPADLDPGAAPAAVAGALEGGDVASLVVPPHALGERAYSDHLKALAAIAQPRGVAVLAVRDARLAGRLGLDGVHLDGDDDELADVIDRAGDRLMVGSESARTRDRALEIGAFEPDYLMFGRVGGDTHDEPHAKNLELAAWWASMVEIPAIVMAGADLDGTVPCAETGAEFVGLSRAVFEDPARAREMVSRANAMLDQNGPRFARLTGANGSFA